MISDNEGGMVFDEVGRGRRCLFRAPLHSLTCEETGSTFIAPNLTPPAQDKMTANPNVLSETDRTRIASEVAETFVDAYYTALNSARTTIKDFYIPFLAGATPSRNLPIINYNGDLLNDAAAFQTKFEEMPYTFYEAQSLNAHVLNPCLDADAAGKTKKDAERNCSLAVQVSGSVRLLERQDGPKRAFSEEFVLVPNKESVGGKGTGKTGEGRQWLIQTHNFRFVV